MKKSLRLTLITGIIFTLLVTSTGLTASASCPLANLFFNRSSGNGNPFGNFMSFFGGNNNSNNNNAGSCPISRFFGNNMSFFGSGNNSSSSNCVPSNNNCPPSNNNCPPANNNNDCTTDTCSSAQTPAPEQPAAKPQVCTTYADEVLNLVNEARAARGLNALELDAELCVAAEVRAEEVLRRFSHTRPGGASWLTAFRDFEISYNVAGENIAKGFNNPQAVFSAWMNSSGHRANILSPNYTHMGLGRNGNGWAQLFKG